MIKLTIPFHFAKSALSLLRSFYKAPLSSSFPEMRMVRFRYDGRVLSFSGINLAGRGELSMEYSVDGQASFDFLLDPVQLTSLLSGGSDIEVTDSGGGRLSFVSMRGNIISEVFPDVIPFGASSLQDHWEDPVFAEGSEYRSIDTGLLRAASTCAHKNDLNETLSGLYLDVENGCAVSSDGFTLCAIGMEGISDVCGGRSRFLNRSFLPFATMREDGVKAFWGEGSLYIAFTVGEGMEYRSRLVYDASLALKFPNWKSVVPSIRVGGFKLSSSDFIHAMGALRKLYYVRIIQQGDHIYFSGGDKDAIDDDIARVGLSWESVPGFESYAPSGSECVYLVNTLNKAVDIAKHFGGDLTFSFFDAGGSLGSGTSIKGAVINFDASALDAYMLVMPFAPTGA